MALGERMLGKDENKSYTGTQAKDRTTPVFYVGNFKRLRYAGFRAGVICGKRFGKIREKEEAG